MELSPYSPGIHYNCMLRPRSRHPKSGLECLPGSPVLIGSVAGDWLSGSERCAVQRPLADRSEQRWKQRANQRALLSDMTAEPVYYIDTQSSLFTGAPGAAAVLPTLFALRAGMLMEGLPDVTFQQGPYDRLRSFPLK
ncbi:unnamed protein product [Gadus morhua 'NCC']